HGGKAKACAGDHCDPNPKEPEHEEPVTERVAEDGEEARKRPFDSVNVPLSGCPAVDPRSSRRCGVVQAEQFVEERPQKSKPDDDPGDCEDLPQQRAGHNIFLPPNPRGVDRAGLHRGSHGVLLAIAWLLDLRMAPSSRWVRG